MVTLKAPLSSLFAAGTLGNTLIYQPHGPRINARIHRPARNPRTRPQTAARAIHTFLVQQWQLLTQGQKATWFPLAAELRLTTFHAFLHHNLDRWHAGQGPTKTYPATLTGTVGITDSFSPIAIRRRIQHQIRSMLLNQMWACPIYQLNGPTGKATKDKLLTIIAFPFIGYQYWLSRPYAPGQYYFSYRKFTTTGKLDAYISAVVSCIVT